MKDLSSSHKEFEAKKMWTADGLFIKLIPFAVCREKTWIFADVVRRKMFAED